MRRILKKVELIPGWLVLVILIIAVYYQFFLLGKIPIATDTLVGAYYPWLDYKWGYAVGVPVKNALISDVFSQFFLWKYLAVEYLHRGIWPLWNPYSFSGTPFLATYHSATLLPFNLLLLLPKYQGWGIYIFGQTLMASLGTYLLIGLYTKKTYLKIAGAIVFCLSGLMTTWTEFGTGVWAAAMLPWIFYSVISFLENNKLRYLWLLTGSLVCLILAGHAQLSLYSSLLFGSFLVYRFLKGDNHKSLLFLSIFWVIGIGICLIQLLPAADLVRFSVRGDEAYSKSFNYGLNAGYDYLRLFAVDLFGNPTTYNYWGKVSYHEQSSFLGTLVLPFILPLLFKRFRRNDSGFWLATFLFSLFMALDTPLTQWFYNLPLPFITYSSASRVFFISSFSGGLLFAFGLEQYLVSERFSYYLRRAGVLLITCLVGFALGLGVNWLLIHSWSEYRDVAAMIVNIKVSLKNVALPAVLLIFLIGITFLKKPKIFIILILIALVYLDLFRFFNKYNPFVWPRLVFPETPIHKFLEEKSSQQVFRIARADPEIMTPNTWIAYHLFSVEGYDPMALNDYASYFNLVNGGQYEDKVGRYIELSRFPSKYLDALNVKYFVGLVRDEKSRLGVGGQMLNYQVKNSNLKVVYGEGASVVLENPDAMPRAYFIKGVSAVSNKLELTKILDARQFDPTTQAYVVSKNIEPISTSSGNIEYLASDPNQTGLNVDSNSLGFVVLANSYSKDWHLLVDQKPETLYEVNGALQGFYAQPGKHHYQLQFYPQSFDLGMKLSLGFIMLFILSSGGIFLYYRKV